MKTTSTSTPVQFDGSISLLRMLCQTQASCAMRKAKLSDWTKLFCSCCIILMIIAGSARNALSQDNEDEDDPIVVQVYDVAEFVTPRSDHPFDGFVVPGIFDDEKNAFPGGGFGGGGGGFGGGGGGGGAFNISPLTPRQFGGSVGNLGGSTFGPNNGSQLTTDDFADVIMDSVANWSWENTNGEGRINFLGTTMIVSQTAAIHKQIETMLKMLGQTKASTKNQSVVTIDAIWLTIDEAQFASLAPKTDRSVDAEVLKKLTVEFGRRGQITCFDGQSVHIAAGNLRSSIDSVIPVVGQNELPNEGFQALAKTNPLSKLPKEVMAQVVSPSVMSLADGGQNKVGYKPVPRWTNYGTVLQVLPRVQSDRQIWIDVSSTVVRPGKVNATMKMAQMEIDKHNMYCQQFTTSIRLNDSTPTLVGGSAFYVEPQSEMQTYLILTASKVVKPETK